MASPLDGIGTSLDTSSVSIGNVNTNIEALENAAKATGSSVISLGTDSLAAVSSSAKDALSANKAKTTEAGIALNKQYASSSGARLVKFNYSEGGDDSQRRAFFQIVDGGGLAKLKEAVKADSAVTAILSNLEASQGFTSFILTGITENHQEKQAIMQTINDYFVATFSGHEPQILNISGILPFDISTTTTSWYLNYLNAYMFLFRASVLAKYKLQLKLILNDFSTYICYPTSFTSGLQASQDNLVQFQMTAVVAQENIVQAKGISIAAQTDSSLAGQVKSDTKKSEQKQATGDDNTPKEVGESSTKKNILQKATEWINTAVTGVGTDKTALALNQVNKVLSSAKGIQSTIASVTNRTGLKF